MSAPPFARDWGLTRAMKAQWTLTVPVVLTTAPLVLSTAVSVKL